MIFPISTANQQLIPSKFPTHAKSNRPPNCVSSSKSTIFRQQNLEKVRHGTMRSITDESSVLG